MKHSKQRSTSQIFGSTQAASPGISRVKTDGRIGSATPARYLSGGFTADNNQAQQPHHGAVGSAAAKHMSPGHKGGVWSPRATKARAMAKPNPKPYANPVNAATPSLKRVKPD